MRRRITIDPITRLEGHGKIDIFLDDQRQVERAYFQVPELRGFAKRVAQSSALSNSAVLSIRRAAEFLRRETLRYLLCGRCGEWDILGCAPGPVEYR